jgi:hypothetical protein
VLEPAARTAAHPRCPPWLILVPWRPQEDDLAIMTSTSNKMTNKFQVNPWRWGQAGKSSRLCGDALPDRGPRALGAPTGRQQRLFLS